MTFDRAVFWSAIWNVGLGFSAVPGHPDEHFAPQFAQVTLRTSAKDPPKTCGAGQIVVRRRRCRIRLDLVDRVEQG